MSKATEREREREGERERLWPYYNTSLPSLTAAAAASALTLTSSVRRSVRVRCTLYGSIALWMGHKTLWSKSTIARGESGERVMLPYWGRHDQK